MKKFNSINIIPFVDIMLVLLAIVLVTSTLIEKKIIPVNLPSSSLSADIKKLEVVITINKDGKIFWNRVPIVKNELLLKIKSLKKEDIININCDKNAKFQEFIYTLNALKANGLENISIITKADD